MTIVETENEIIPMEVKAEDNIAGKSLSVYTKTFSPEHRVRISGLNLQYDGGLLNLPAPLCCWLSRFVMP